MIKLAKLLTVGVLTLGLFSGVAVTKSEASTVTKPAGSNFFKSASNLTSNYYTVQDSKGKTVRAKTTASTALTTYTGNYSYGTASFTDYDKVAKTTYKTTASTQAYTKSNTKYKLTARNNKGKLVNVKLSASNVMTKVNASWYKDSFKYTSYVKVKGKWVKRAKTATVYVPSKYVKKYTSYTWTKRSKKAKGYFYTPPATNGVTLAEYNQVTMGMTYEQVVAITGEKMSLQSSYEWNEDVYNDDFDLIGVINHSYESYTWEYELYTENDYIWRHADLDFEDGKVTNKYQYGLK
jgi:hypothetical protein